MAVIGQKETVTRKMSQGKLRISPTWVNQNKKKTVMFTSSCRLLSFNLVVLIFLKEIFLEFWAS